MPVCKRCKIEKKYVSARGLCKACSGEAIREGIIQMKQKKGVYYEKWKEGLLRAIEKGKGD